MNKKLKHAISSEGKEFVIEVRNEPPKFYVDDLERTRTVIFTIYKTIIRKI